VAKLADLWLHPKQGTDAALAMAMGHVILREFHLDDFPYFGNIAATNGFELDDHGEVLTRKVPVKRLKLADGEEVLVATVFDLFVRQLRPRPRAGRRATSRRTMTRRAPTPRPGPRSITGVPRDKIIQVAREFAANAEKTNGRSMVIIGAGDEPLVPHGHELPRRASTCW
jgi:nitrate reductase alpha subunit